MLPSSDAESFLIVDDDVDSTFLARRNLLQAFPQAQIEHAASGQLALAALQQHTYTLIITDYRMPWMDGLTLVRKIRALGLTIPIVMRTAMEDIETRAHAAGVDLVLPWFRWRDLGSVVKDLLHSHPSGREPPV